MSAAVIAGPVRGDAEGKRRLPEYKNPNQPGATGGNNNLFITMFVMFAVFLGLQFYHAKHNPQTASPNQGANQSATQTAAGIPQPTAGMLRDAGTTAPAPGSSAGPTIQAPVETTTTVENELYRITFSNRGGEVRSWTLKKYKDASRKNLLDLVSHDAAERFGYPLSLYTYDPALTAGLRSAMYVPSVTGSMGAPGKLSFEFSDGATHVVKTFSFDETYVIHADVVVTRNGVPQRALLSWPGGFGDQENLQAYAGAQLDTFANGRESHLAPKKIAGGQTLNGPFDWAGVSDMYFAAVFLPDQPGSATLATLHDELTVDKAFRKNGVGTGVPARDASKGATVQVPILGAALGDVSGHTVTRLYAGPKAVDILKNVHAADRSVTLESLVEFGFFGVIGKYLFLALQFIHAHIASNWGWAIVILTVVINLIILPLRVKTMQSGLKMQRIQPQLDAIKAKYKDLKVTDPKRNEMNAEIMQVQKDNGVNMFGGCIPTLIQLPLLFAFFGMLPKVVELRQAHWYWLPDLTAADPYHILPIVMVLSQFLVQFYTPSPGVDPQQQKMMAFMMPAVSGYMTWNYASGLALYWSVGNLISIAQQAVMNRTSLGREMREIAARRARRKAGLGVGSSAKGVGATAKAAGKSSAKTIQGRR